MSPLSRTQWVILGLCAFILLAIMVNMDEDPTPYEPTPTTAPTTALHEQVPNK